MNIYFTDAPLGEIPQGFDAACITLDAGLKSRLEWKNELSVATLLKERGYKIFWILAFDFNRQSAFTDEQVESLRLAVDHFHTAVFEKFREETIGACLYQGDHSLTEGEIRALELLAGSLPDEVEAFIMLDASALSGPVEIAQTLSKERFPHFTLAVKGVEQPVPEFGWESNGSRGMIGKNIMESSVIEPVIGICVPEEGASSSLDEMALWLKSAGIPFRMIPEALLTSEWQGLDFVFVDSDRVNPLFRRRLMGFCAAGGTIVTMGELLGMPIEMSCEEWKSSGTASRS